MKRKAKSVSYDTTTTEQYNNFQQAFDFFNRELFDAVLPDVLFTVGHGKKYAGYFAPKRFRARDGGDKYTHEIMLNADHFGSSDKNICQTIVHELCHHWQCEFGKPTRSNYHNKQWGAKMKSIGLHPSHNGKPGGKETGQRMADYVIEGGPFDLACAQLEASGFKLKWYSPGRKVKDRVQSKVKYTCPSCKQNAWAKPGAALICGKCVDDSGELQQMTAPKTIKPEWQQR